MKEADENADGEISFEEFNHLMNDLKNVCNQDLVRDSSLLKSAIGPWLYFIVIKFNQMLKKIEEQNKTI